jgi:hypothetical protein
MRTSDVKIYAWLLLGSALLSLLVAAHHPEAQTHDVATALRFLAGESGLITGVHGALLLLGGVELLGLYGVARLLGLARPLAAAGLILVGAGFMAMIGAAAINGFAVPAFAVDYRNLAPSDARAATMLLRLCWDLNQALAAIGAVAWGLGLLAWSAELARRDGPARLVGLLGGIAAVAIAGGVGFGFIRLHVGGFIGVTALLSAWSAAASLLMLTGRLAPAQPGGSASPA